MILSFSPLLNNIGGGLLWLKLIFKLLFYKVLSGVLTFKLFWGNKLGEYDTFKIVWLTNLLMYRDLQIWQES